MECEVIKMEETISPRHNDFLCISDCLRNDSQLRESGFTGSARQKICGTSEQAGIAAKRKLNSNPINRLKMKRARATVQKTWKKANRSFKRVHQFKCRENEEEEESLQKQVKEIKTILDSLSQAVQLQSSKIDILLHLMYTQKFGSNQPLQAVSPSFALLSADKTESPQAVVNFPTARVQLPDTMQTCGSGHSMHPRSLPCVVDKSEIPQVGHFSAAQVQLLPNTMQKCGSSYSMHPRSSPCVANKAESPHAAVHFPTTEVQLLPDTNQKCGPSHSMYPHPSPFIVDKTEHSQAGHFPTAQVQLLPDTIQKCGSNLSAMMHPHPTTRAADKAESPQAIMHYSTAQVQLLSDTIQKPSSNHSAHLHSSPCLADKTETQQMTMNFQTDQVTQAQPLHSDTTQNGFHINNSLDSLSEEPTFQSSSRGNAHIVPTAAPQQSPRVIHVGAPCAVQPEARLSPSSNHKFQHNSEGCSSSRAEFVIVGGNQAIKMSREKYQYCTSGCKPTKVALRFVDTLVPRDVLIRSTVLGTREFERLDSSILTAIKAEVDRLFSHQCRNIKELCRMWDCCKTSIGKRCQKLRIDRKNGMI